MRVQEAQREEQAMFVAGLWGQHVSSALWSASAAFASWRTPPAAIWFLVLSGFFIFPVTQLLCA
jgi:hypothetical protein